MSASDWLLWQIIDSGFPTGGFAHSGGLEAAWQQGELATSAQLRTWFEASIHQAGHSALPFVLAAYQDLEALRKINEHCEVFLSNHVARRASQLQGQALLSSARRIFKFNFSGPDSLHLAPALGAVGRILEVGPMDTARAFLFMHLRGLIASGVRLGAIGPYEGQALQHQLGPFAEGIMAECSGLGLENVAQTAPLLDIWQGTQDRLYSRLFQS